MGKLGIIGDQKQFGATIPSSEMSEFAPIAQMSLMERLIEAGHPYTVMEKQYRMHPHITHLVNTLIYNDRLIDNPCTWNRDDEYQFYRWAKSMEIPRSRQALFLTGNDIPIPKLNIPKHSNKLFYSKKQKKAAKTPVLQAAAASTQQSSFQKDSCIHSATCDVLQGIHPAFGFSAFLVGSYTQYRSFWLLGKFILHL